MDRDPGCGVVPDNWGIKKNVDPGGLYATNYRLIFVCFPSQFDDEVDGERAREISTVRIPARTKLHSNATDCSETR